MKYYRGQFRQEQVIPKQFMIECHVVPFIEALGWDFTGSKILSQFDHPKSDFPSGGGQ